AALANGKCTIPFREIRMQKLSIVMGPWGHGADDFHDFSSNALGPLLGLFTRIGTLELRTNNCHSPTTQNRKTDAALDIFHSHIGKAFHNGLQVETLDIDAMVRNVGCLNPLVNSTVLRTLKVEVSSDGLAESKSSCFSGDPEIINGEKMLKT